MLWEHNNVSGSSQKRKSTDGKVKVKVAQSCLTLCHPHGILQARILEWVTFPFSRGLPIQGSNPGLLHCRWILYQLSHHGSPLKGNRGNLSLSFSLLFSFYYRV